MNKRIKKKWLKALRSGEYKQIMKQLKRGGGYCCLGVLEEVEAGRVHNSTAGYLSKACEKRCGLDAKTQTNLTALNDYKNYTFKQIADWVEKNL